MPEKAKAHNPAQGSHDLSVNHKSLRGRVEDAVRSANPKQRIPEPFDWLLELFLMCQKDNSVAMHFERNEVLPKDAKYPLAASLFSTTPVWLVHLQTAAMNTIYRLPAAQQTDIFSKIDHISAGQVGNVIPLCDGPLPYCSFYALGVSGSILLVWYTSVHRLIEEKTNEHTVRFVQRATVCDVVKQSQMRQVVAKACFRLKRMGDHIGDTLPKVPSGSLAVPVLCEHFYNPKKFEKRVVGLEHHPSCAPLLADVCYIDTVLSSSWKPVSEADIGVSSFKLSPQELAVVNLPQNVLLLGRSGTGKTTSAVIRLWSRWQQLKRLGPVALFDSRYPDGGAGLAGAGLGHQTSTAAPTLSTLSHVQSSRAQSKAKSLMSSVDERSETASLKSGRAPASVGGTPVRTADAAANEDDVISLADSSIDAESFFVVDSDAGDDDSWAVVSEAAESDWDRCSVAESHASDVLLFSDLPSEDRPTFLTAQQVETASHDVLSEARDDKRYNSADTTAVSSSSTSGGRRGGLTEAALLAAAEQPDDSVLQWQPVFITLSPLLCSQVSRYYRKLTDQEAAAATTDQTADEGDVDDSLLPNDNKGDDDDDDDEEEDDEVRRLQQLPHTLAHLNGNHFPLFVTLVKFLHMLDGTLRKPFFARQEDGSVVGHETAALSWTTEGRQGMVCIPANHLRREVLQDVYYKSDVEDSDSSDSDGEEPPARAAAPRSAQSTSIVSSFQIEYQYFADNMFDAMGGPSFGYHPSLVFTEIRTFIKGSAEALATANGYLSEEEYLHLGRKRSPTFVGNRQSIYHLFVKYENLKQSRGLYDECDLVHHIYRRLQHEGYSGTPLHAMFLDEVQDFSQAVIMLLFSVCRQPNGFFLCGDTAQCIARGASFRFCDLRSLFQRQCRPLLAKSLYTTPAVHQLTHNYRSHRNLLLLGQSVIRVLESLFPLSIDKVVASTSSAVEGPLPVLMDVADDSELFMWLGANQSHTNIEFGAQQVVIVRDQESKKKLPEILRHALCLTVFECKGLEFDDVILYNFFHESSLSEEWQAVTGFKLPSSEVGAASNGGLVQLSMDKMDAGGQGAPIRAGAVKFDPLRHALLCSELKHLYTAVTRPRKRLFVVDSSPAKCAPMFKLWLSHGLAEMATKAVGQEVAQKTSPAQWRAQGIAMLRQGLTSQAVRCFELSDDPKLLTKAKASALASRALLIAPATTLPVVGLSTKAASAAKKKTDEDAARSRELFIQASDLFMQVGLLRHAARCQFSAGEFANAAAMFSELGLHMEAAQAYSSGKQFSAAAQQYLQAQRPDLAIPMLQSAELLEEAVDVLVAHKEYFSNTAGGAKAFDAQLHTLVKAAVEQLRVAASTEATYWTRMRHVLASLSPDLALSVSAVTLSDQNANAGPSTSSTAMPVSTLQILDEMGFGLLGLDLIKQFGVDPPEASTAFQRAFVSRLAYSDYCGPAKQRAERLQETIASLPSTAEKVRLLIRYDQLEQAETLLCDSANWVPALSLSLLRDNWPLAYARALSATRSASASSPPSDLAAAAAAAAATTTTATGEDDARARVLVSAAAAFTAHYLAARSRSAVDAQLSKEGRRKKAKAIASDQQKQQDEERREQQQQQQQQPAALAALEASRLASEGGRKKAKAVASEQQRQQDEQRREEQHGAAVECLAALEASLLALPAQSGAVKQQLRRLALCRTMGEKQQGEQLSALLHESLAHEDHSVWLLGAMELIAGDVADWVLLKQITTTTTRLLNNTHHYLVGTLHRLEQPLFGADIGALLTFARFCSVETCGEMVSELCTAPFLLLPLASPAAQYVPPGGVILELSSVLVVAPQAAVHASLVVFLAALSRLLPQQLRSKHKDSLDMWEVAVQLKLLVTHPLFFEPSLEHLLQPISMALCPHDAHWTWVNSSVCDCQCGFALTLPSRELLRTPLPSQASTQHWHHVDKVRHHDDALVSLVSLLQQDTGAAPRAAAVENALCARVLVLLGREKRPLAHALTAEMALWCMRAAWLGKKTAAVACDLEGRLGKWSRAFARFAELPVLHAVNAWPQASRIMARLTRRHAASIAGDCNHYWFVCELLSVQMVKLLQLYVGADLTLPSHMHSMLDWSTPLPEHVHSVSDDPRQTGYGDLLLTIESLMDAIVRLLWHTASLDLYQGDTATQEMVLLILTALANLQTLRFLPNVWGDFEQVLELLELEDESFLGMLRSDDLYSELEQWCEDQEVPLQVIAAPERAYIDSSDTKHNAATCIQRLYRAHLTRRLLSSHHRSRALQRTRRVAASIVISNAYLRRSAQALSALPSLLPWLISSRPFAQFKTTVAVADAAAAVQKTRMGVIKLLCDRVAGKQLLLNRGAGGDHFGWCEQQLATANTHIDALRGLSHACTPAAASNTTTAALEWCRLCDAGLTKWREIADVVPQTRAAAAAAANAAKISWRERQYTAQVKKQKNIKHQERLQDRKAMRTALKRGRFQRV